MNKKIISPKKNKLKFWLIGICIIIGIPSVGVTLYNFNALDEFILHQEVYYFWGFSFGIFGYDIFAQKISKLLREILKIELKEKLPPHVEILPQFVGIIERAMYIIALLLEQPIFLGLWLTLKTAARWEGWSKSEEGYIPGRATYNIFLLGNGLSILYAVAGMGIICWGNLDNADLIIVITTAIICFSLLLRFILEIRKARITYSFI